MPKFRLAAQVTVSAYTTVEAKTLDDAIAQAINRTVHLPGSGYTEGLYWMIDEADGSPDDIVLDSEL
jgi:hypothetical protein